MSYDIGRHRSVPDEFQRGYRPDEFTGPSDIADKVIINEHDLPGLHGLDFTEHMGNRAVAKIMLHIGAAVVAELAAKRAAAAGTEDIGI